MLLTCILHTVDPMNGKGELIIGYLIQITRSIGDYDFNNIVEVISGKCYKVYCLLI